MQHKRLRLYHLNLKYVRDLANVDENVMSVSPQLNKEKWPFIRTVVICDNKLYCIPLTSPKPKHEKMKNDKDFSKVYDKHGKLIGCLNFNNMIPVNNEVIIPIDIKIRPSDSAEDRYYKQLLDNQLDWCNDNIENITKKANKLYKIITETPEKSHNLTKRCCDFKKLEKILENKWS